MKQFSFLPEFDTEGLNTKYADLAVKAKAAETKLHAAYEALQGAPKEVAQKLYSEAMRNDAIIQKLPKDASATDRAAAQSAAVEAKDALTGFLRGDTSIKLHGEDIQLSEKVGKDLRSAFIEAEEAANRVAKPYQGMLGMVRTQQEGVSRAAKANLKKMNFLSSDLEGFTPRFKAFAHGSAVVGSVIGMGDAIIRSKDSDGEDRSAMVRMAEFVVSGGLGAVALIGGPAAAR